MYELLDALQLPLFPWHAAPKHRFVRIEPDDVSGRRFQVVAGPLASSAGPSAPAERASRFLPSK